MFFFLFYRNGQVCTIKGCNGTNTRTNKRYSANNTSIYFILRLIENIHVKIIIATSISMPISFIVKHPTSITIISKNQKLTYIRRLMVEDLFIYLFIFKFIK